MRKRVCVPLVMENDMTGSKRVLTKGEYAVLKQEKLEEVLQWRELVQLGFAD